MYFEIKERIGTISENALWNKEVNIVTWGNRPEKYDIRSWKNE